MTNDLLSRQAAFFIIKKILDDGMILEPATSEVVRDYEKDLSVSDRGFIRHITTVTIRRLGQLDKIIDHCTKTRLGKTQTAVRHVLRLGITQLLYSDVPAYAAVNSSVNLVNIVVPKRLRYLKNTVNAVLRKVERERDVLCKKFGNSRLNIPSWLLKSWDQRYGQAAVKDIIETILSEPPLDICLKPSIDKLQWSQKLDAEILPTGGLRIYKAGKITKIPGYNDGHWWVQDMAASIPVQLMGAGSGDHVLDLCAAPGGKAAQSAASGADVTAVDLSHRRLMRLQENMKRLKLKVDVVTSDILEYKPLQKFDYILLDAPCSSTGTIRRHPEILHSRKPSDVEDMVKIQHKMLDQVSKHLNVGGILVYSVCSMEQAEGPDQIDALLARDGSLQRKKILSEEMPALEQAIMPSGDVQTLPNHYQGGMDGFFISRLLKK